MTEKLPEAKEVVVKLSLEDAEKCLQYIPKSLKEARKKIEEAIEHTNFWNFLRNCEYLKFKRADFHLTGLMNPAWHLYCTHPENKSNPKKLYVDLPEEEKKEVTGPCNRISCPIYKG